MRPLTKQAPYSARYSELWVGQALFASTSRANTNAFAAWLESLDGQISPFKLPLQAGKFSQPSSPIALAEVPALGSDELSIAAAYDGIMIEPGTLLTIGDIETDTFQLFEVVAGGEKVDPFFTDGTDFDDDTSFARLLKVAPRVGCVFSLSDPVVIGTVNGKFKLSADELKIASQLTYGTVTVDLVEAV
jgi:hypothetical protein